MPWLGLGQVELHRPHRTIFVKRTVRDSLNFGEQHINLQDCPMDSLFLAESLDDLEFVSYFDKHPLQRGLVRA